MATRNEILKTISNATKVPAMSATELAGDSQASETLRLELLRYMQSGNSDSERDEAQHNRMLKLAEDLSNARD